MKGDLALDWSSSSLLFLHSTFSSACPSPRISMLSTSPFPSHSLHFPLCLTLFFPPSSLSSSLPSFPLPYLPPAPFPSTFSPPPSPSRFPILFSSLLPSSFQYFLPPSPPILPSSLILSSLPPILPSSGASGRDCMTYCRCRFSSGVCMAVCVMRGSVGPDSRFGSDGPSMSVCRGFGLKGMGIVFFFLLFVWKFIFYFFV